jgi:hypothetical protein
MATLLQNIDTDQIIPAEYLTLVPSKVAANMCFWLLRSMGVWQRICCSPTVSGAWCLPDPASPLAAA